MLVFAYFLLFKYDAHMVVLDVMKNPELPLVFKPVSLKFSLTYEDGVQ